MKKNFKYDRISEDMKAKINIIINERIDELDFVSVVDVELTKDLGDAKVYVQALSSESEDYIITTLSKKEGFIKKELARTMNIRKIPNLKFSYDHGLDNYNKIDELLKK